MPFQGHTLDGIEPFVWVGIGIGGRWLYGHLFDSPAANGMELVLSGTIIGTVCYAVVVFAPIVLGRFIKSDKPHGD